VIRARYVYRGFPDDPTNKYFLPGELSQKIADMSNLCSALTLNSATRHSSINMQERKQLVLKLEKPPFDIPRNKICKLTELYLDEKNLNAVDMITFSQAIANGALAQLESLVLYSNKIGDTGMIAFAEALKPNSNFPMGALGSLKQLDLSFNEIGDVGMVAFAEALKPNLSNPMGALGSLQELGLPLNQIGDAGMIAFANAIKPTPQNPMGALPRLKMLFLFQNEIGITGMVSFADAIKPTPENPMGALPSLQHLAIDFNPGDDAPAMKALAERKK
jgi:Leucine-rich repeat (LRR) protein